MTWSPPVPAPPTVRAPSPARRLIGLALAVPAFVVLVWQLVVPSVSTVVHSLRSATGFGTSDGWAGLSNYRALHVGRPFLFGVALAILPIIAALVVGPLVGWLGSRSGRTPRLATRAIVAIPVAFFCPAGIYLTAVLQGTVVNDFAGMTTPTRGVISLIGIGATTSIGIVCALSATLFLAALNRRGDGSAATGTTRTALWTGIVVVLTLLAMGIGSIALPLIVTGGGPGRSTTTPALAMVQQAFSIFRPGAGSAISTLMLVVLGVLGLATTVVLVATRMRLDIARPDRGTGAGLVARDDGRAISGAGVAAVAVAVLVLIVSVFVLRHWLSSTAHPIGVKVGHPFLFTWAPAMVGTVVQLLVAGLAGVGIGGFRPLGRWSGLLLLPFAPWLFVGTAPLAIAQYTRLGRDRRIGGFADQLPQVLVSIPALVAATLLAAAVVGYAERHGRRPVGELLRELAAPVGAVALAVAGATLLINAQRVLWPYLVSQDVSTAPAQVVLLRAMRQFARPGATGTAELYPLPLVLAFALLAAAAAIGLDRVALRTGRDDDEGRLSANSAREGVAQR